MRSTPVRKRVDAWAIRHAASQPERNPKVIALLIVLGANLLPTAIGAQALPGSLTDGPTVLAQGSTIFVVLGCLMCVVGLLWPRRDTGLAIEVAGCFLLAGGLFFYSVALLDIPRAQRAYAFGLTFGLAVGSLLRTGQIALYIRGRVLRTRGEYPER